MIVAMVLGIELTILLLLLEILMSGGHTWRFRHQKQLTRIVACHHLI